MRRYNTGMWRLVTRLRPLGWLGLLVAAAGTQMIQVGARRSDWGLLISNTLGDRVQSILMWLVLLLLGLTWLVPSAAFLTADVFGWWWAGVVVSGGVVGAASLSLWRLWRMTKGH